VTDIMSRIVVGFKRDHGAVRQSRHALKGRVFSEQIIIRSASKLDAKSLMAQIVAGEVDGLK